MAGLVDRIKNWGAYKKLLVSVVGGAVLALQQYYADGDLSEDDWIRVASAVVGAYLVWQTAEGPKGTLWSRAKAAAYGLTAVLATALTTLPGGLTGQEKFALVVAFLTGAGVLGVKNDPETTQ